jgi:hypothetical protein
MGERLFISESKFLERTRVALTNAASQSEISAKMAKFGMDQDKLLEGIDLHKRAAGV